jgi:single-strand DNA-binding protein
MSYEVEGKLYKKYDTEQKSGTFQAREFILLEEKGQYPNYIKFQLVQDKVETIDDVPEGAMIKVYFDLRGREWQGKYFTNLQAWRIETLGQEAKSKAAAGEFPTTPPGFSEEGSSYDDLPF